MIPNTHLLYIVQGHEFFICKKNDSIVFLELSSFFRDEEDVVVNLLDGILDVLNPEIKVPEIGEFFVVEFEVVVVVGVDDFLQLLFLGLKLFVALLFFAASLMSFELLVLVHREQFFEVGLLKGQGLNFLRFLQIVCLDGEKFEYFGL